MDAKKGMSLADSKVSSQRELKMASLTVVLTGATFAEATEHEMAARTVNRRAEMKAVKLDELMVS